jgi:SAM-dependent methyltransferase
MTKSGTLYWDGVASEADQKPHYLDPFLGEMKRRAHLDLVERWGGIPTSDRLLKTDLFEEAMGPDALLSDLTEKGATAIGIDVSWEIVARARRRTTGKALFVTADARHLPFAEGTVDFILSTSTLDHFPDPSDLGRSLRELARILKPNGRLIVTLDNRQNVFDPLLRMAFLLGLVPYFIGRSYRMRELIDELKASGLKATNVTAILHNPRLTAIGAVFIANRIGWNPLVHLVHQVLYAAQRFGKTRWKYRTGCFVAAKAVRRG